MMIIVAVGLVAVAYVIYEVIAQNRAGKFELRQSEILRRLGYLRDL